MNLVFNFLFEIAPFFAPGSGAPLILIEAQPTIRMLQFWKMILEIVLILTLR